MSAALPAWAGLTGLVLVCCTAPMALLAASCGQWRRLLAWLALTALGAAAFAAAI